MGKRLIGLCVFVILMGVTGPAWADCWSNTAECNANGELFYAGADGAPLENFKLRGVNHRWLTAGKLAVGVERKFVSGGVASGWGQIFSWGYRGNSGSLVGIPIYLSRAAYLFSVGKSGSWMAASMSPINLYGQAAGYQTPAFLSSRYPTWLDLSAEYKENLPGNSVRKTVFGYSWMNYGDPITYRLGKMTAKQVVFGIYESPWRYRFIVYEPTL